MQKYHDEPKQYKGYLKSALTGCSPLRQSDDDAWQSTCSVAVTAATRGNAATDYPFRYRFTVRQSGTDWIIQDYREE